MNSATKTSALLLGNDKIGIDIGGRIGVGGHMALSLVDTLLEYGVVHMFRLRLAVPVVVVRQDLIVLGGHVC